MMHVGREMMHVGLMRRHTASERSHNGSISRVQQTLVEHNGSISRVQQTLVELWCGQATICAARTPSRINSSPVNECMSIRIDTHGHRINQSTRPMFTTYFGSAAPRFLDVHRVLNGLAFGGFSHDVA